jgi:hypothetical protein
MPGVHEICLLGRNSVGVFASDWIKDMELYRQGLNSVNQFRFEMTKFGIQRKPIWTSQSLAMLRRHLARNPKAPLRSLCDWMKRQHNISISLTEMSRVRIRMGYRRNRYAPHGRV